ncbi:phage portal protein [Lacticaseibacillus hulanensis]|uniref:phage portal protein n=1 Tax=Lacticaseibacillus hulanensis TaxID=2493111 RepID=UPI000FDBC045|nr:phage portal protein [Lacticaseibacillus hulanensis]
MINPFQKFNTRSRVLPSGGEPFIISNGVITPNHMVDATFALRNSDVFAVVNLIASDVAGARRSIAQPFDQVVEQPNNLISGFNFWQSVVAQMLLAGNAYAIITARKQGVPTRIELAAVSQVTVTLTDYAKDLTYDVNWTDERGIKRYKSKDVLHFRLLASGQDDQQLIGISPLQSLNGPLNMQQFSNDLTLATLKHAINPSVTLTVPQGELDKDAKENIRTAFEEQTSGENAGRAIVLDQGLSMSTIQINSDVAKFLNTMDFGRTAIAEAFGVPDSYLNGQGDQQSSLNMVKSLYANALRRYVKPIESEVQAKFGVPFNIDESSSVDATNADFVEMVTKLAGVGTKGATPIISAQEAHQMLMNRGIL